MANALHQLIEWNHWSIMKKGVSDEITLTEDESLG